MIFRFKKIILLAICILMIQIAVFTFLDWQASRLLNPSFRLDRTFHLPVSLKETVAHELSFNNKYLACLADNELLVMDLMKNQLAFSSESHLALSKTLGFQWLPDRNSLVYLLQSEDSKLPTTYLVAVDFDVEPQIIEPKMNREISFSVDKLAKIEMSTYTNNLYFLVSDQEHSQDQTLFRMDIMKTINRINLPGEGIISLAVSNKFGTLYLESYQGDRKSISSSISGERSVISTDEEDVLLGCYHDRVYIGKVKDGLLQEIRLFEENNDTAAVIWEGKIPFDPSINVISSDKKILLKGKDRIDSILIDGRQNTINFNPKDIIVLSPTGKMYLEIKPQKNKTQYRWRNLR